MSVGVVIIGRNEGERLRRCLASVIGHSAAVVYVDSGSSDGSVALAQSLGATTVDLDMSVPFTAARARNAGLTALCEANPELTYVQFVDGDCELVPGWLSVAHAFLDGHADVAMVCGRLRERHPENSVYNLLCDIEWDAPAGDSRACGGNAMAQIASLQAVGGYRADLIAGEEPELCVRLRNAGWKIHRLSHDMATHDANMTRFWQWWKRSIRGGYAFAQGAHVSGSDSERRDIVESRRIWLWAGGLPAAIVLAVFFAGPWSLVLLAVYPAQVVRLTLIGRRSISENFTWALFNVLGKFPQLLGQLKYFALRMDGSGVRLIEYK